jgi:twinkle protein
MGEQLELSQAHAEWLEEHRKIPSEIAAEMGIVSKGKRIAFEYRRQGRLLWRQVRVVTKVDGRDQKSFLCEAPDGRTLKEAGIELSLWNEDDLLDESLPDAFRIITEGQFDAATMKASGAPFVVSVPNGARDRMGEGDVVPEEDHAFGYLWDGSKLKPELDRVRRFLIATDGDKAGTILREELALRLGKHRCWFVTYPAGTKDANEVLLKFGPDAVTDLIANAKPMVPDRLVVMSAIPSREKLPSYSSGWSGFDDHFKLRPPQLITFTGKANAGKSQLALAFAMNWARLYGIKTAVLQFEDDPDRNREDMLAYARAWRNVPGETSIREEPEAWVDRMFRVIAPLETLGDDADYDLKWLTEVSEEAARRHGCKVRLIDPWNEIEHLWGKQDTEATYLNRALRDIKKLNRRLQMASLVVVHPTKEGGKQTSLDAATGYDINGGAVWMNKSDILGIVWRDSPDEAPLQRHFKIDKSKDFQRFGQPGIGRFEFIPHQATYRFLGTGMS